MRLSFHLQNWSKLYFPQRHYACWAGLCRCQTGAMELTSEESDKEGQDIDKDHRLVYVWDSSAITVVSSTQLALMRMCNPKTTSIWNCAPRPVSVVKPVVTYARSSSTAITQRDTPIHTHQRLTVIFDGVFFVNKMYRQSVYVIWPEGRHLVKQIKLMMCSNGCCCFGTGGGTHVFPTRWQVNKQKKLH